MIAGIDYSITSPAICIGEVGAPFSKCHVYCFGKKAIQGNIGNIRIDAYPDWETQIERFISLQTWAMAAFDHHRVESVALEGYAFAAKGKVFNLAENTGVLKVGLHQRNIPFEVVAPTSNKKYACGKGNASKEMLYEAFVEQEGVNLKGLLEDNSKDVGNPTSDIIDAYYLHKYMSNIKNLP